MRASQSPWAWAVLLLLVGTAWAAARLFEISTQAGGEFPAYSTLRADPMGSKVMHDALAALPGYRVQRSFQPMSRLKPRAADAIFVLGSGGADREILDGARKWADAGSRVVIVFAPRPRTPPEKPDRKNTGLENEWHVRFRPARADRRWTAFDPVPDSGWRVLRRAELGDAMIIEKPAQSGAGSVVFAGEALLLSNEGLFKESRSQLLLELLDGRRQVIFEESHLGVEQGGSVGQLLRRYGLGGAALVLLVLAGLFFWRASTSFLPPAAARADEPRRQPAPGISDEEDALVHLVRGSIAPASLTAAMHTLWTHSGRAIKAAGAGRRDRVTLALENPPGGTKPLEAWNRAHDILKRPYST